MIHPWGHASVHERGHPWEARAEKRKRLNVFEIKCLKGMAEVAVRNIFNYDVFEI